ncbi:double-strand break repair protein MRE11-like [Sitodiplosis mosellana]|uniref:double-strand break repair protein MRE11-like n=1 Tax=Sitodiplosis mosellana TaxID=263140 RepID=UPI0024450CD2|nr:double-strand break repair protein MRE11-like [Sitodiplosis mosellana]XP_055324859.1 double-strand break repair protein MRE11-like [Sitodiplosis mosellana]
MASTQGTSSVMDSDPKNRFKILLATDIHLGYKEKCDIIGHDSFITFEEILKRGQEEHVDFILLGGDLFDKANPSKETYIECTRLLKKYIFGDAKIGFNISDDYEVNYNDPNVNIAMPIFSINGNHDDSNGRRGKSAMDLLHTLKYVNYFGKYTNLNEVHMKPILMSKGTQKLALYGLSHIPDKRLVKLLHEGKVTVDKPDDDEGQFFNLLTLHQNRAYRGADNFIKEEYLPDFMDFVFWGHEHDYCWKPKQNGENAFSLLQLGSSVATSLTEGESKRKNIGLLEISNNTFEYKPIKLETVRPMVFRSIDLRKYELRLNTDDGCDDKTKVKELIRENIEQMIEEAKSKETANEAQPKEPLIRLRILYQHEKHRITSEIRFGQQYNQRVANPSTIIKMTSSLTDRRGEGISNRDPNDDVSLQDYMKHCFENSTNEFEIFTPELLTKVREVLALQLSADENARNMINNSLARACDFLKDTMPKDKANIDRELAKFRDTDDQVLREIETGIRNVGNSNQSTSYGYNQSTPFYVAGQKRPRATTRINVPTGQPSIKDMFKKD